MRAAIIGCGRMGAEPSSRVAGQIPAGWLPMSHLEALQLIPDVKSIVLCDANEALLKLRGEQYGIQELYRDYRELLDSVRPEILTVATRTPAKAEIIDYACRAGVRGIYVEKPFANSLSELEHSINLIKAHGVKLSYGVNRRFHPVYRAAKIMIDEGRIGDIQHIAAEYDLSQLLWTHPHTVDLFLYYIQPDDSIFAQSCLVKDSITLKGDYLIDTDPMVEHAHFKFGTSATASIIPAKGLNLRIAGTQGNLTIHANGTFLQLDSPSKQMPAYFLEQTVINPLPTSAATVNALTELISSIKQDTLPSISMKEIVYGMKMLFACVWSSLNKSTLVNIDDTPADLVVTGKFKEMFA